MAAAGGPRALPSARAAGTPGAAERCRSAVAATADAWLEPWALELGWQGSGEEQSDTAAARGRWETGQPTAAAALLARCLAADVVSQVTAAGARRGPGWSGCAQWR